MALPPRAGSLSPARKIAQFLKEDADLVDIAAEFDASPEAATLRINANYEDSDVPVPAGVGPNGGIMTGTRLTD
jgi:hypothetical protein